MVNKIIDGVNTVTGIFSKLPGVADLEIGKFEKIVVSGAETTDGLTKAAEDVAPAVAGVGNAAQIATPQMDGLTAATETLSVVNETAADRIQATRDKNRS